MTFVRNLKTGDRLAVPGAEETIVSVTSTSSLEGERRVLVKGTRQNGTEIELRFDIAATVGIVEDLDDLELERDVALRLVRARGAMPYGGIVHAPDFVDLRHGAPTALLDPHCLAAYLEALADVLGRVAEENTEKADRLRDLEHDVAAVRRLFAPEIRLSPLEEVGS